MIDDAKIANLQEQFPQAQVLIQNSALFYSREINIVGTANSNCLRSLDLPFSCILVKWVL